MAKIWVCGLGIVVACVLLVGCGGGDDNNARLQQDLDATKAELDDLQMQLEAEQAEADEAAALNARIAALQQIVTDLTAEEEEEPADEEEVADDEEEEEGEDDEEQVVTPPPPGPTPTATTGEDVRRAHRILAAFDGDNNLGNGIDFGAVTIAVPPLPTIAVERGTIKVESGAFKPSGSAASLSGFAGFSLKDDTPADAGVDEETWVLYTDIETRRGVLEHHYNGNRVVNEPGEFVFPATLFNTNDTKTYTTTGGTERDTFTMSGINAEDTDGERRVTLTADADNANQVTITRPPGGSFSASVRGNSVSVTCMHTEDCTFQIGMGDSTVTDKTGKYLTTFTFGPGDAGTGQGGWVFRASSQSQIAIPSGDQEFMYFGWWLQAPDSAGGQYSFEPRVGGMGLTTTLPTGTFRYVGSASGWYVEEERSKTVESDGDFLTQAVSGIFTATASLQAVSGTVSGVIDNFREGGTSLGDWEVELKDATVSGGEIDAMTDLTVGDDETVDAGEWGVRFVPSRVTDEAPVSAVGYFNATIENSLHLSGAFGAKKQ